jgi:hypothetical protein
VDSSSGAIGTAVNNAIVALVEIIAAAPADQETRQKWLERLFEAHAEDQIPYIEQLADHWGKLCVTADLASRWADELIGMTRLAVSSDKEVFRHFHGTSACLSALYSAGRYDELIDILTPDELLSAKVSTVNAHYTGREIINQMWEAVYSLGFKGGKTAELGH